MAEHWQAVRDVIDRSITLGEIPGAVAAAGVGSEVLFRYAKGQAAVQFADPAPMQWQTYFDVASLTKVVATLPAILLLASQGRISLGDSPRPYLPEADERWDQISIHQLLTHQAGLASHRDYYQTLTGVSAFLEAIAREPFEYPVKTRVSYSDLGYIVLGAIIEKVSDMPLDEFVSHHIFQPLGMDEAFYRPGPEVKARCAATEPVDGRALVGVVHDENARAMGGVAGHAGLFATMEALIRYVMSWTDDDQALLPKPVRQAATRRQTVSADGNRGLGWVLLGDSYDVSGDFWPTTGCGHTGFTGTSMQFDGESGLWAILLTNRVHFGRGVSINGVRRRFHNAVVTAVAASKGHIGD